MSLAQAPSRAGRRVLIVEDDPASRWLLMALLKRLGHDCVAAANGAEALELAPEFRPQIVLMDLMMPVLDGLEATRRLKQDRRTRGIPVLALTGDATPSGEAEARRAGCDAFLTKPVVLPELVERMRGVLAARGAGEAGAAAAY